MNWIKENKIASGIILVLIVVLAVVYFDKQSGEIAGKNEFQKRQECSQYTSLVETKIKESGRVFEKDSYSVKEILYSPKLNTCLYAWVLLTTFDPKEIYSIDDIFGGGIFTAGISENAEELFYQEIAKLKQ
ncbi:MAG: hypothetical protein Q7S83_04255 [bacterium]|nr:hypothetical protein [bacterium]